MLRVPPLAGADGDGSSAPADPLAAAAEARHARLADAAWMLESETSLQEGLGRVAADSLVEDASPGPVAPRFDNAALGFIERLFADAPGDVSAPALGQARARAYCKGWPLRPNTRVSLSPNRLPKMISTRAGRSTVPSMDLLPAATEIAMGLPRKRMMPFFRSSSKPLLTCRMGNGVS